MSVKGNSPAATGPAGPYFESQVGAHYLLSMLALAEPRGLPGTTIERVTFQRASEGHPLDDVVVHAHDRNGQPCELEVQVKRSVTFAPADPVFKDVVEQVARAAGLPRFWTTRHELAVATAHTSHKIQGPYQDVLRWARHLESAQVFFDRLARPGSASNDARRFVSTFAAHLRDCGLNDDPKTVWALLRRFQILVFDFTATGSASEQLAQERAARVLAQEEAHRAGDLWGNLITLAVSIAADGGGRTRQQLTEDLGVHAYRLVGDPRTTDVRAAIAEASRHALEDIDDRVGDVVLTRPAAMAAVHAAMDQGRYIEIRGNVGVGKSGVLKHFAQLVAMQSRVLVLSPGRTEPRGWMALRASLGFKGTARELLSDLASEGGALLLLDGLEGFDELERHTVVDLVRDAIAVPGMKIIATARRDFGIDEPSWLPAAAIEQFGRATPVVIDELADNEVQELRHAAPRLVALLSDAHPAREVVRNLYRLARLAQRPPNDPMPRTEVEMAQQWWTTADGNRDSSLRERGRLLKAMAGHALGTGAPFDASGAPPAAIEALVKSESLRDLGNDRVAFRHDVLREWAIANLLDVVPNTIEGVKLGAVASPSLSRSIDLAARMKLEGATDSTSWLAWLNTVSRPGAHLSWRRAALLAVVRSEITATLLDRVADALLQDDAKLLVELIRTIKAVDVTPAAQLFAQAGVDPALVPTGLTIPTAPSWHRLIQWLLGVGAKLPAKAIPDVADLYIAWSGAMLGQDQRLTPLTTRQLYLWLEEIELAKRARSPRNWREPFDGRLEYEKIRSLEETLRVGFLLFCNSTSDLATAYLDGMGRDKHNGNRERNLLRFRGALAQAAPARLAQVTAHILTREEGDDDDRNRRRDRGPFNFADHELFPPSPAQGPFLDLLTQAPEHGLWLVRRLVDHAVAYYSGDRPPDEKQIVIELSEGPRAFPWSQSYTWSRDEGGHNALTSALMALEAWAHGRVEAKEPIENVLSDVLGAPGAPACYLLVAVDVLISHWPASREAIIPFLASPELLALDRVRQARDGYEEPDLFGLKELRKEPKGKVTLESLRRRLSRHRSLEELLVLFSVDEAADRRATLHSLLLSAAARLGAVTPEMTFEDPAFMAAHALNRLDAKNWKQTAHQQPDGTLSTILEYVPPPDEQRHLDALVADVGERLSTGNLQMALGAALEDGKRASPKLATAGVAWAKGALAKPEGDPDDDWMREQAIVAAAMLAVRDGDEALQQQDAVWMREVLESALRQPPDERSAFQNRLRYNRIATAFAGMAHLLCRRDGPSDRQALLAAAARHYVGAAPGFAATVQVLHAHDARLPRAILRIAFRACIRPNLAWDAAENERGVAAKRYQAAVEAAIDVELSWMQGASAEPRWPEFPPEETRPRRRLRIRRSVELDEPKPPSTDPPEDYVSHQPATRWLEALAPLLSAENQPWLRTLAGAYATWTAQANGAGLDKEEEIADAPDEWNGAYFNLVAHCVQGLTAPQVDELVVTRITSLPDEPFFDVVTSFLRSIDEVYFNGQALDDGEASRIRARLAQRLMESAGWRWLKHRRSDRSIEVHIGPAIATSFFNTFNRLGGTTTCYLLPKGVDRLDSFMPTLAQLVATGASHFVTVVALNLLEVSPRASQLPFLVNAAKIWLASYPDDTTFWVDERVGARVCALIERIRATAPGVLTAPDAVRADLHQLLASLIQIGVAEASALERALGTET